MGGNVYFSFVLSNPCFIPVCSNNSKHALIQYNDRASINYNKKQCPCRPRQGPSKTWFFEMKKAPNSKPPINVPSGILLGMSCVLAIAFVGSLFELSSGHPQYGREVTGAILVGSLPSFLFLFYAAIQKGKEESNTFDM
ncbi:hypothetical protein GpartN1_g1352.t1 [Galdieria partita]|uniref:Uncharacterized protein n=1 Tax=Galdieria partita TaxID=83374 RepID=A0A9C7PSD8_9RHOD|nr:hypothetical protein GpartN1_g1352.t1 [Galdieria partita]